MTPYIFSNINFCVRLWPFVFVQERFTVDVEFILFSLSQGDVEEAHEVALRYDPFIHILLWMQERLYIVAFHHAGYLTPFYNP